MYDGSKSSFILKYYYIFVLNLLIRTELEVYLYYYFKIHMIGQKYSNDHKDPI